MLERRRGALPIQGRQHVVQVVAAVIDEEAGDHVEGQRDGGFAGVAAGGADAGRF